MKYYKIQIIGGNKQIVKCEKDEKEDKRFRVFVSILYPDSMNPDTIDILNNLHVQAFLMLHDKDIDIGSGELKKAHYHLMIMYDAPKSLSQVMSVINEIKAVGCQVVDSTRGQARYLCHLDNPEKIQYSPSDVQCFGGVDYMNIISLVSDKYNAIGQMMDLARLEGFRGIAELLDFTRIHNYELFRSLCDNSLYVMREYINSMNYIDSLD